MSSKKPNSRPALSKRIIPGIIRRLKKDPDAFLRRVSGVIHIGANTGQERELYAKRKLDVLWIEPVPAVFEQLKGNLEGFPRQKACRYLVTDKDDEPYEFHIASNRGESSSIFDIGRVRDTFPQVYYESTITLKSITFSSLVKKENIDTNKFDALVMDTEGAELLVLKGAAPYINRFKYIKTEAADFESRVGSCTVKDIEEFLGPCGFRECSRHEFASHPSGGKWYNIVYKNTVARKKLPDYH